MTIESPSRAPLYEKLAGEILEKIENGLFQPGERLPSVRQLSSQKNLSITTVLQAYRALEDRGLIEARPQSGYYVRATTIPVVDAVITSQGEEFLEDTDDLSMRVILDTQNPALVQFGAAIPAPDLLPTVRLNRILAQVVRNKNLLHNTWGTPEGCIELRAQIAKRSFLYNCPMIPDDIVITAGCMEAISLSLRAICKHGDLVAVESPAYFGILQAIEALDLRALEIPTNSEYGISLEALRFALEHHPIRACVVISNFNNPVGSCMPDDHKKELVELLAGYNVPLIEDDIYGELAFNGVHPSVARAYDPNGLVLLCSSFTKDVSPSYRVGWLAPGRFTDQIRRLKLATNISTSILPQLAIAEFLGNGGYDFHLRKIRRAYAQKVALMERAILHYFPPDCRFTKPEGGFLIWVQLPPGVDSLALYRTAIQSGITIAPGYIFSTSLKYKNYIRLNAAYWSYQTERALQKLGDMILELKNQSRLIQLST